MVVVGVKLFSCVDNMGWDSYASEGLENECSRNRWESGGKIDKEGTGILMPLCKVILEGRVQLQDVLQDGAAADKARLWAKGPRVKMLVNGRSEASSEDLRVGIRARKWPRLAAGFDVFLTARFRKNP